MQKYVNSKGVVTRGTDGCDTCIPISEERVTAVEELKKTMLLEAAKKQADGYLDDWREITFGELQDGLTEERNEVDESLFYVDSDSDPTDAIRVAKRECAHAALYVASIHDKLNALELEAMQKRKSDA